MEIRWNKEKKIQRELDQQEQARKDAEDKAKSRIAASWNKFKSQVKRAKTKAEIVKLVADFRVTMAAGLQGVGEGYRKMTMEMINDKLSDVMLWADGRNVITEHAPKGNPRTAEFETPLDLEEVEWVKPFLQRPNFVGLLRRDNMIVAFYGKDPVTYEEVFELVGSVPHTENIQEIPTVQQFMQQFH